MIRTLSGKLVMGSGVDKVNDATSPFNGSVKSWKIDLIITPRGISDPGPRKDYLINGLDIQVGDWIGSGKGGNALQITSIDDGATTSKVSVTAEDIDLYNMSMDSQGSKYSGLQNGYCLIFSSHEGLGVVGPGPTGTLTGLFFTDILSRFNNTFKMKNSGGGGSVALSSSTIHASTMNTLSTGSSIEFQLPTGSNFYLTSLSTSGALTVECHSTSAYQDTNPYKFVAISGHTVDDGSFISNGTTYYGSKNILLQNSEDQSSPNSFWKITNNDQTNVVAITLSILSFGITNDISLTINDDGTTKVS